MLPDDSVTGMAGSPRQVGQMCFSAMSGPAGCCHTPAAVPDMARPRTLSRRGLSTYQSACKPGFVGRDRSRATTIPLGDRLLGRSGNLPGRRRGSTPGVAPCRPYSVLLPVGFTVPLPLPVARWALTPPFHPCRGEPRRSVFCGTVPGVAPAGRYPAPCFRGARTFLPRALSGDAAAAVRPADGPK
jgi:hypothetical protein